MPDVLEDLRAFIAYRVREGFEPVHAIVENAAAYAHEQYARDDLQPEIKRLIAESLAEHGAQQAGWEASTDCDRLDEAFATLNGQGIVARQDFSCCNNCGFKEIWDEVEAEEKLHPVDGYVFYHLQCTEQAIKSGRLLMAFGSIEENPEALQRVGKAAVVALLGAGLDASWGGTAGNPIVVDNLIWRRRR